MTQAPERVRLPLPPVGVKLRLGASIQEDGITVYEGTSYCEAIRLAARGEVVRVGPGSIRTCKWAPVVLGFKEAENDFEKGLIPRAEGASPGLLAARPDRFPPGVEPDVVILRGPLSALAPLFDLVGEQRWAGEYAAGPRVDASALALLRKGGGRADRLVNRLTRRILGRLRPLPAWKRLTEFLFGSELVTRAFDQFIKRTMADMSICRNSTVIPHLTGKVNLSFFCTGGIAWGLNDPDHLTSGWPYPLYREIEPLLTWDK